MFPRSLSLVLALAVAVATIGLTACSPKPENSPVIRKKFAEVEEMKDDMEEIAKNLRRISGDLTVMKDEISNLRALAPDGSGGSELVRRLEALESRIDSGAASNRTVASTSNSSSSDSIAGAITRAERTPPPRAGASSDDSGAPRLALPAQSESQEKETEAPQPKRTVAQAPPRELTQPKPKPQPKRTVPRGKYHTMSSSDSLEALAQKNGISVAELRQANRLPAGARVPTGQRIFIPAKN